MKRAIVVVAWAVGALIGSTPEAFAHGERYGAVVVHDGDARRIHQPVWPQSSAQKPG